MIRVMSTNPVPQEILLSDEDASLASLSWYVNKRGYAFRTAVVDGKKTSVLLSRVVLGLAVGDPLFADHLNGNRLDNRRVNLRPVTKAQNAQNKMLYKNATSRFRGVYRRGKRWCAHVRVDGVKNHLGTFDSEEEAGRIASRFRAETMPFSAGDRKRSQVTRRNPRNDGAEADSLAEKLA